MYVYRKINADLTLIPKGLYVKMPHSHTIPLGLKPLFNYVAHKHIFPSGLKSLFNYVAYKHIFPSGMRNQFLKWYKANRLGER
jgi:hypothetical protein